MDDDFYQFYYSLDPWDDRVRNFGLASLLTDEQYQAILDAANDDEDEE